MKTIELSQATAPLCQYARGMHGQPVILTRHGRPVAALVLISNADLETMQLSTDPKFAAIIRRSRARLKTKGGISSAEMRQRLRRLQGRNGKKT